MALKNKVGFILFLIVLSLLAVTGVNAVSISPSKIIIGYEPNVENRFDFDIGRADYIETYLADELAPYATIIDPSPNGGPRKITVSLTLPEGLSPGRHRLLVGARQSAPEGTMIGGRAAVQSPIDVDVPYPGIYIEASVSAPNINVGEKEKFTVSVSNKGTDSISAVSVKLKVIDSNNNTIAELASGEKPLAGVSAINFDFDWDSSQAKAGPYRVVADVLYDGNVKTVEGKFKIGSLDVQIKEYTKEFPANAISPFVIEVESGWNEEIKGIYGEILVANRSFRTPTFNLKPWQQLKLNGYLDSNGIAEGEYDARFIVYYADKTAEKSDRLSISQGANAIKVKESPSEVSGGRGSLLTTLTLIALGAVFVVALIALVIIIKQRAKGGI
jgi:hypothetical protein